MMAHPPSFRTTVQTEYVHWYGLSDKDATLAHDEQESNCSNLLLSFQKSNTKRQICGGRCSSDLLDNIEVVSSLEVNDNVSVPPLDALSHAKHIRAEVYQALILQKTSIYDLVVWNYICINQILAISGNPELVWASWVCFHLKTQGHLALYSSCIKYISQWQYGFVGFINPWI